MLICLVLLAVSPLSAEAHPADMYYHTHSVTLSRDGLSITWELVPGPLIAQSIWFEADHDQDGTVSAAEAGDWVQAILGTFSVNIDQDQLGLQTQSIEWPSAVQSLYSGEEPILIYLYAPWPEGISGDLQITIANRFNPKSSLSWYEIHAEDGLEFSKPAQNSGTVRFTLGADGGGEERLTGWESGSPSIPWVVETIGLGELAEQAAAESEISPAAGSGPASILEGLIKSREGSFAFTLGALFLAALLGALHALSPGHGKTIVAAYLVGTQGRPYHAVALGGIVTLTHTGSVFALGILTLTASRYLLAADVFPVLELVSGLLILFLGLGLLYPRLRLWYREYRKNRPIKRKSGAESQSRENGGARLVIDQPIEEIGPAHSHDPDQLGSIPRGPSPGGPLDSIRWRNLVPLAISGGLVPCPDAIAILLVAATINRIAFGLSLIVSFSLGLAVVLIAIGLLIVQGKRLFERLKWFNKAALIMPIVSALIVLTAGGVLSASAIRNIQADSPGSSILQAVDDFELKSASVIYTALDENNQSQLIRKPAAGGTEQIISAGGNIWNFAVAPDHSMLVYASDNGANGSMLWAWDREADRIELLLECATAFCSEISWSPDSRGFLFSRLDFDPEINPANVQTIWWFDLATRESAPLFQDALTPGFSARWSPDGQWLSYSSINPLEIKLYHISSGESRTLSNSLGYPVAWSPDSKTLILQDLDSGIDSYLSKLYSYSLEDDWLTMLAVDQPYDEYFPAWSPDGEWLAVVRRAWVDGLSEEFNQVWVMRADGTEARQYTHEPGFTYGQPSWSPDGRYLLFDFREVTDQLIESGVMILDLKREKIEKLTLPGSRPAWFE
jgi:ABC-type nickel/cobalt efflux system permease component RcnA